MHGAHYHIGCRSWKAPGYQMHPFQLATHSVVIMSQNARVCKIDFQSSVWFRTESQQILWNQFVWNKINSVGLVPFILRSCQHNNGYIDGQSQI